MIEIRKQFRFEASHVLPRHPGKCARLHGHSWELEVAVRGEVDPATGFVCDYYDLSQLVNKEIITPLDHSHLGCGKAATSQEGEVPSMWKPYFGWDFYPTSENLVLAIAKLLQLLVKELAPNGSIELVEVTIKETCTSAATWRP